MKVKVELREANKNGLYEVFHTKDFTSIVAARKWAQDMVASFAKPSTVFGFDYVVPGKVIQAVVSPMNKFCPEVY